MKKKCNEDQSWPPPNVKNFTLFIKASLKFHNSIFAIKHIYFTACCYQAGLVC